MASARRSFLGLGLVAAAACATTILVLAAPGAVTVRAIIAVPLALYGVGFAVHMALDGGAPGGTLNDSFVHIGLSFATLILTGLLLAALGLPLTGHTYVVAVAVCAVAGCVVATIRQARARTGPRAARPASSVRPIVVWTAACLGVGVLFAILVGVLRKPLPDRSAPGYTLIWAQPSGSTGLSLGVRSQEREPTRYRLKITPSAAGQAFGTIRLSTGQTWDTRLALSPIQRSAPVHLTLYRIGSDTPYRSLTVQP